MTSDWLSQLAPEHAPPTPGWWPPAPGWWVLALLCLVLGAGAAWLRRHPHRRHARAALRELGEIRANTMDDAWTARAIENLLRRYALTVFGVERVGRLTGDAWLRFLNAHSGESFAGETGRSLLGAAFGSSALGERDRWVAAADAFVRGSRASRISQ